MMQFLLYVNVEIQNKFWKLTSTKTSFCCGPKMEYHDNSRILDGRTDTTLAILKSLGVASVKKLYPITDYTYQV